ncbi:sugar porter family MFS transporter [Arachnia propionica]|jgi:MFS transporter, SP family|uniref:sugar porter family MFS transporter n=1 Tax=Arachnia propionica TaxID=1750 RepID=UPI000F6FE013|nr:sugar porter family MFS transporter [Arachnia propionica]VEJ59511.1 Probable metabolite transport protein CsbC [Arachnia propionica]
MSNSAQVSAKASSLVIRSAIVAAVGGLIFGFDTAVISGANAALKVQFNLDDGGLGATVAIATVGTIVGALIGGRSADYFGRRKLLFFIGILYILGALGTALAPSHLVLMIFRFVGGLGVGLSSVCAPIYTAEIAPAKVRGRLVGLVQFNIVLGILVAYLSNYIVAQIVHDPQIAWRWMLGVMVVPSVLFLVFLVAVPETPRWLMAKGHEEKAIAISRRLCNTVEESDEQIQEIRDQLASAGSQATLSQFFTRRYFKVIALAFFIAMFNQLSGINAILYYAPEVMKQAGADDNAALLMSVGVGLMNLIATMAALTVIDRIGRRSLMIVGSIGYLVSMGFLTAVMFMFQGHFNSTSSTLVLVGLLVFIAAHAFGQGSVIWVFISEIFPTRVRGLGQSLGSLTHWVFAAITTYAFPPIIGAWGGGWAFSIFLVCMFGQLVWVLTKMPETKGIPLEEMEDKLGLNK